MRRMLLACLGPMAAIVTVAWCGHVVAGPSTGADPASSGTTTTVVDTSASTTTTMLPAKGPLVIIPVGCSNPVPAFSVFTGRIIAVDDPDQPTTARFSVDRQLYGDLGPYLITGETDVVYGSEARFLTVGVDYIVGVRADEAPGRLVSTVREKAPLFGGDAVIGVNDSDTACPRLEDPVRTFRADGTAVDTGVLTPLHGHRQELMWALLKPLLLALVALIALVLLKLSVFALARALREMSDGVPPPPPPPASPRHPSRPVASPRAQARRPAQSS
ncbi:MAG: hypothetical protein WCK21_04835 [Actinomycetota bacterium]